MTHHKKKTDEQPEPETQPKDEKPKQEGQRISSTESVDLSEDEFRKLKLLV